MATAEFWSKIGRWFISLNAEKKVLILFCVIVGLLTYDNLDLREENAEYRRNDSLDRNRADSIRTVFQKEISECEAEKFKIVQETSAYWSKKYEEMEKRLYKEYETVNNIKRKR